MPIDDMRPSEVEINQVGNGNIGQQFGTLEQRFNSPDDPRDKRSVEQDDEGGVPIGNRIAAVIFGLILIGGVILLAVGVLAPAIAALVIGGGGFGLAIFKLFFGE
ncbi:MAG: DUF3040 domain-containing protein [Actinobacteria bacterium]|nr:DUF3040 domain-containing protein [Actinomycetota bacterium]